MRDQIDAVENLKTIKQYYGDLTEFLIQKQNKSRGDKLEQEFANELENFLLFWQSIFNEFNKVSEDEVANIIRSNKKLKKELYDILEKVVGFRPPPDRLFLDLVAIRKVAIKLKNNDAVKFLNFDHYKKHNKKINDNWIRERKAFILKRMRAFEEQLNNAVKKLKYRLNQELWRLQAKRNKQFDFLTVKYIKCKNLVSEINSQEAWELKKLKRAFLLRNEVPKLKLPKEAEQHNVLADLGEEDYLMEEEELVEEIVEEVVEAPKKKKKKKRRAQEEDEEEVSVVQEVVVQKTTGKKTKKKVRDESTESVRTLKNEGKKKKSRRVVK